MWPLHIPAHQCQSDLINTGNKSRGSNTSLASVNCLPVLQRLAVGTLLPSSDKARPMALLLWPKWLLRRRRRRQKHLLMTPAFMTSLARQHMIIFPAGWWLVAQAVLLTLVRAVSEEVSKAPAWAKGSKSSCTGGNSSDVFSIVLKWTSKIDQIVLKQWLFPWTPKRRIQMSKSGVAVHTAKI